MKPSGQLGASFRDPSGFLFVRDGTLYRQVNRVYAEDNARLIESDLHEKLVKTGLLIPHAEVEMKPADPDLAFKILPPERVQFI
ncbi:MAG: hypothetical protein MUO30_15405 [Anaerolineales bacterium]|nr:hypothetical protein [Anaerolineales bacterium]